jgi:hypothetical protein
VPNGDFASYDLNQDGMIGQDEWSQFTANAGGEQAAPPAEFNLDDFIAKVSSGNFTDDDMLAFSNWYMGQQMGQQAGQMQYQNDYLAYLNNVLAGNNQALEQAGREMEFQQGPYWDWYVESYFPHQQQRDQWDFELAGLNMDTQKYLSDNQKAIADIEQGKAKDYALAQFYGTEQSKYGADAARQQYLMLLEQQANPPSKYAGLSY